MTRPVLAFLVLILLPATARAQDPDPMAPQDSVDLSAIAFPDEATVTLVGTWQERVREFAEADPTDDAGRVRGRALYDSLGTVIVEAEDRLSGALDREAYDQAVDLDAEMVALYEVRDSLIGLLDDATRADLFGLTQTGLDQVVAELHYFTLHTRYEIVALSTTARTALAALVANPVGWVPKFLKAALALLVFVWWRRTGAVKLNAWRRRLIEMRPIRRQNLRIAKALWYFDHIRKPLEWLVLLVVVVNVSAARSFGPALFFWAVVKWILIGWTAVLLVDALAIRGAVGRDGSAPLRRKSLWVLCWWIVLFALGRQLVRDFFGQGALFHWTSVALLLVLVPLGVLFVAWWRDEVMVRLEADPNRPGYTHRLLVHRTGLRGYLTSLVGGLYLIYDGVRRWVLRVTANSELGRRALAQLSRSEIARQAERDAQAEQGEPIPEAIREALLNGGAPVIDRVARAQVAELRRLFENTPGCVAAVVGQRGSGKTTVLRRLADRLDREVIWVDCPYRSFEALLALLARAVGAPEDADTAQVAAALAARDRPVVVLDDVHRLARPVIGGMDDVARLRGLQADAGMGACWLYGVDAASWQYIRRFRSVEPIHNHVSYLDPWTEDDVGRLIMERCEAADVDPDFTRLVLPRQLDDRTYDSLTARNQAGFLRVLWDDCGGNPAVALRLWTDSLVMDGERIVVRLAHPPGAGDLDGLTSDAFFVLRTLLRLEVATVQEIIDCLPDGVETVEDTLQLARSRGMIKERDGHLTLSWRWNRAVRRSLLRRNMIA